MEHYKYGVPVYDQWNLGGQMMCPQWYSFPQGQDQTSLYNAEPYQGPFDNHYHAEQSHPSPTEQQFATSLQSIIPPRPLLSSSQREVTETVSLKPVVTNRNQNIKPPYSYISLICMAIANTKDKKATLREITKYIEDNFPYYRSNKKWHGSIRHNLTINDCFVKLPRRLGNRSCLWTIDSAFGDMFDNGSLRRRRYRFKDGTDGWSKAKIKAAMKQVKQQQKKSTHISPACQQQHSAPTSDIRVQENRGDHISACTLDSTSVLPLSSPTSPPNPFSECSSSSWDTSEDLDEILHTIDSYDQTHSTSQFQDSSVTEFPSCNISHLNIISTAFNLSENV